MKRKILLWIGIPCGLCLAAVLFFAVRHSLAVAAIEKEYQTAQVTPLGDFGTTATLHILPLIEAAASSDQFQAEHGVSYRIQTDRQTLLFDFGFNQQGTAPSPLEHNLSALGYSPDQFDAFFISHPHPDHLGGLSRWWARSFSLGVEPIDLQGKPAYVPVPLTYPGLAPTVTADPTVLMEGVAGMGTLPFPEVMPLGIVSSRNVEQVLAVHLADRGIVLITGCGHPGLSHILDRAEALFDEPIVGLVGGLHYGAADPAALEPELARLRQLPLVLLALSPHDSGPEVIEAFRTAFPEIYQDLEVGRELTLSAP